MAACTLTRALSLADHQYMRLLLVTAMAVAVRGGTLTLDSAAGTCNLTVAEDGTTLRSSCGLQTPDGDIEARFQRMQAEIDSLRRALEAVSSAQTFYSCKDALEKGRVDSGVYRVTFGGSTPFAAYCEQRMAGGGWTLLLTVTDPTNDLPGSVGVSPFETPLNEDSPSLYRPYARVWNDAGVGLLPVVGDEVLLRRGSNGDWVRFVVEQWCGGAEWHGYQSVACGSAGHDLLGLAHGPLYDKDGTLIGSDYNFHSCSHVGGCGSEGNGGDGVGFSNHAQWLHGANNAYGGAHASNPGAELYWGGVNVDPSSKGGDVFAYFYREAQ